jgi:hypothetical protein
MAYLDKFTTCGKICSVLGGLFLPLSFVIAILSLLSLWSVDNVEFCVEGAKTGECVLPDAACDGHLGYQVYMLESEPHAVCDGRRLTEGDDNETMGDDHMKASRGIGLSPDFLHCEEKCGEPIGEGNGESPEEKMDLERLCEIHLFNDYKKVCSEHDKKMTFDSPTPIYVMDIEKRIGTVIGGLFWATAYGGTFLIMCISSIFCLTGPCCCCTAPKKEAAPPQQAAPPQ